MAQTTNAKAAALSGQGRMRGLLSEQALTVVPELAEQEPTVTPVTEPAEPMPAPPRRRRVAVPAISDLTATHYLQATVFWSLHNRYRRACDTLKKQGKPVLQRDWLAALLYEGPQSASELRDLHQATWDSTQAAYHHERENVSVVNGRVPAELWLRYDGWCSDLFYDERLKISVTQAVICLMETGPKTAGEVADLVERWTAVTKS
jgi:hypothetical protein